MNLVLTNPFLARAPTTALIAHISRLRKTGILVVEGVLAFRRLLADAAPADVDALSASLPAPSRASAAAFAPYEWRGRDYLAKMVHDCDFVIEIPSAVRARCARAELDAVRALH